MLINRKYLQILRGFGLSCFLVVTLKRAYIHFLHVFHLPMAGRVVSTQDIDAYNDGVKGNSAKGILSAAERGTSAEAMMLLEFSDGCL